MAMSRSLRREVHHVLAADAQGAAADLLEPRDHPQRRRLPASRRADEDQELAVVYRQAQILDRLIAVPVGLADPVQHDLGHYLTPSVLRRTRTERRARARPASAILAMQASCPGSAMPPAAARHRDRRGGGGVSAPPRAATSLRSARRHRRRESSRPRRSCRRPSPRGPGRARARHRPSAGHRLRVRRRSGPRRRGPRTRARSGSAVGSLSPV